MCIRDRSIASHLINSLNIGDVSNGRGDEVEPSRPYQPHISQRVAYFSDELPEFIQITMPLIINPQPPDFRVELVRAVVRVPVAQGLFFFSEKIHVAEEAALDMVIEEKLARNAKVSKEPQYITKRDLQETYY